MDGRESQRIAVNYPISQGRAVILEESDGALGQGRVNFDENRQGVNEGGHAVIYAQGFLAPVPG